MDSIPFRDFSGITYTLNVFLTVDDVPVTLINFISIESCHVEDTFVTHMALCGAESTGIVLTF